MVCERWIEWSCLEFGVSVMYMHACYSQLAIWLMHQILFYSRHLVSEGCSTIKDPQKYSGAESTPHKLFTCQILCLATGFCSLVIRWLLYQHQLRLHWVQSYSTFCPCHNL